MNVVTPKQIDLIFVFVFMQFATDWFLQPSCLLLILVLGIMHEKHVYMYTGMHIHK